MRCLTPDTTETCSPIRLLPARETKAATMAVAMLTPDTTPTKGPIATLTATTAAAATCCPLRPQLPEQPPTTRRRPPIRTYSKKRPFSGTAADGASRAAEPAAKRQNTTTGHRRATGCEQQVREDQDRRNAGQDTPEKGPMPGLPSPRKRVGILRYFQPEATPPRSTPPAPEPAPAPAPAPDGAAAETVSRRRRQKRRLTIRPGSLADAIGDDNDDNDDNDNDNNSVGPDKEASRRQGSGGSTTASNGVQMTLSLAIVNSSDGGGSVKECRECNILYNPLHEKDVRFHARYHASFCRSKTKTAREER